MKNGLLVYRTNPVNNIFNIGDYIQSLAARQYFDHIDVYINREELGTYSEARVRMILNGWFTHDPSNFPPSNNILPLFVAFHLNSSIYPILDSTQIVDYFKRHQPIGCRDYKTAEILKARGIDAYFTGCLTLTLGNKYKVHKRRNDHIYIVDPFHANLYSTSQLLGIALKNITKTPSLIKLTQKYRGRVTLRNYFKTLSFYNKYKSILSDDVILTSTYINHEIPDRFETDDAKFEYAVKLLDCYANARYVITSRIHCALPCLALNTPVMFVERVDDPEISKCRMGGLLELFHRIIYSNESLYSTNGISYFTIDTNFKNKPNYITLKDKLESICGEFIKNTKE